MVQKIIVTICTLLISFASIGQTTQNIHGTIRDKESKSPLPYASIVVLDSSPLIGTKSDSIGNFTLPNIPIGRWTLKVTSMGYKTIFVSDVELNAGKEKILEIDLEENVTKLKKVRITSGNAKDKTVNDMIGVSGRIFSTKEANRFAGSQNDPARMARNYAGVSGASDQRNDIIIRGNSPQGLLWRIEGIPVPNPNHFAGQGSTGGPVSIINYKLLSNSDFITGAFPAEYGNALSGVFDIKMRKGNNKRMERTLQVGALGLEAMIEGPLSKKNNSSYLIAYRYSTLSILDRANIDFGFASVPSYQDLSFKFNLPSKKYGIFKLFGIGGNSKTDFLDANRDSTQFSPANRGENVSFGSETGILGLSHMYFLNNNTFIKTTLASTYEGNKSTRDSIQNGGTLKRTGGLGYSRHKFILNSYLNQKVNKKHSYKVGIIAENINYQSKDSLLFYNHLATGNEFWGFNTDIKESTNLLQGYGQWKYKINDKLILNAGAHLQFLTLNNKFAVEPRFALNYQIKPNQKLSFGYGLHNQTQPYALYFYQSNTNNNDIATNRDLGFTTSNQFISGYDISFKKYFRVKAEAYFQALSNVPVEQMSSSYSAINSAGSFVTNYRENLENAGSGINYGVELTFEKFFSNNYYFLVTTSLFQSKYKGSDNVMRNTSFNGNYVFNALGGYEFKFKRNLSFLIDAKMTVAGGLRYTPLDINASIQNQEATYIDAEANTLQNDPYIKPDIKFTVRKSFKKKMALEFALDIQNFIDRDNVLLNWYDRNTNAVNPIFQNGRFPTFQLKLEF